MGEVIKERFLTTDWVLSEKLHCLFCGHQGLWLGDEGEWQGEGIEHYCAACNTLSLAHPMVMELLTVEKQKQRRDILSARERSAEQPANATRIEWWCACGARQIASLEEDGTICQRCDACDKYISEGTYTLTLTIKRTDD